MSRKTAFILGAFFILNTGIWFTAGYVSGLAKGKGWRAAVINGQCRITCSNGLSVR